MYNILFYQHATVWWITTKINSNRSKNLLCYYSRKETKLILQLFWGGEMLIYIITLLNNFKQIDSFVLQKHIQAMMTIWPKGSDEITFKRLQKIWYSHTEKTNKQQKTIIFLFALKIPPNPQIIINFCLCSIKMNFVRWKYILREITFLLV